MQRGKYPVKDVEASYQKTAEAEYDNSFKVCIITIGVFLMLCIILLLCTLPFTSHEPLRETQSQPQPDTDALLGERSTIDGAENPPNQPVPEEGDGSHISNTGTVLRRKISKTATQTTAFKVRTSTEISVLREENEYEHTAVENEKDSKTNTIHQELPVVSDSDDRSFEYESWPESGEHEQENGNENDQLPPHPTVPQQKDTSTKKSETQENEERKPEQPSYVSTPVVKDNSSVSEQERTSKDEELEPEQASDINTPDVKDNNSISEQERISTKNNEALEDEESKFEQSSSDVGTPGVKDNSSASEQERTSTKKNETSENKELEPEQTSDVSSPGVKDNSSTSEKERTSTNKNETSENKELEAEQASDVSTPAVKDNSSATEQEITSTNKNETSEKEERKPKQLSDISSAEVKDNSAVTEKEGISSKSNETSENEERKPKLSSDGGIDEVKYNKNETENIGENETSIAEEDKAVSWMNAHYKEREHDFNYKATLGWPLFHYQKNESDSMMYGCYGFIEPQGKVRSTYYIYDSSGYHAVTPEEQFELILGPLKADNETIASDERNAQGHQRDKRKVKQWNYEYFLHKCGQPLPRQQEDTEITTRPSSSIGLESPGTQEKQLGSTEGLPELSKPSNDSENDQKPRDEQPPNHEEASGVSSLGSGGSPRISTTLDMLNLGPQQVTLEPHSSSNVSENGENSGDKQSPGHKEGSEVPQNSSISTKTIVTPEISQTVSQQFTPEPPRPSNSSGNRENPVDELRSGQEKGSTETSYGLEKSHLKPQQVTLEPYRSFNVSENGENSRDKQSPGHKEGSEVPQKSSVSTETSVTPEISQTVSQQLTSEPPRPSNSSGNRGNLVDELGSGQERGSTETSNGSEKSHLKAQQVTLEPLKPSNATGGEQLLGHEGGSGAQTKSETSAEISNTTETPEPTKPSIVSGIEKDSRDNHDEQSSVPQQSEESTEVISTSETSLLDKQQVTSKPAKPSTISGNEENSEDNLPTGHDEESGVPQNIPETSHLGSDKVTSGPARSSNTSENKENHGDEQPLGHEGGSNAPQKSGESAKVSTTPETTNLDSQEVTPEPYNPFNISGIEKNPGDELSSDPDEGSGVTQKVGESDEIKNTSDTYLDGQQVTPELSKAFNVSGNGENHGDEQNPSHEVGSMVTKSSGKSAEIAIAPVTSNLQSQHVTSESPKRFTVLENEENPENEIPPDHDEGFGVTPKPGELTEINNTPETLYLDSQQVTSEPLKPLNFSENWKSLGGQLSSDNENVSVVPEKSRESTETSATPESPYLEVTQESPKASNVSRNEEDLRNELSSTHEDGSVVPGSAEIGGTTETTHVENQQNKTETEKPTNEEEGGKEEAAAADVSEPENLIASNNIDSQEGSYSNGWSEGLIA